MASHDQHYEAGRTEGHAEERSGQMTESMKEKARGAKEKAAQKTEEAKEKTKETAEAARQKTEEGKENTKGVLQQTGEKVKSMAERTTDAVKHTLGLGGRDEHEQHRHRGDLDPHDDTTATGYQPGTTGTGTGTDTTETTYRETKY